MGRPVNYKKIGGNVAEAGSQVLFNAYFEGEDGTEPAWLKKQVSETRFRLVAVTGGAEAVFTLMDENSVVEGGCYLSADKYTAPVVAEYEADAVEIATGGNVSDGAGSYDVTLVGGTSTVAAVLTVTVVGTAVTAVTVKTAGNYTVQPTNPVTVTGLTGTAPTFTVDWVQSNIPVAPVESVSKITEYKVHTFEGGRYSYVLGTAPTSADQVKLESA